MYLNDTTFGRYFTFQRLLQLIDFKTVLFYSHHIKNVTKEMKTHVGINII